jgi:hypothetical protein
MKKQNNIRMFTGLALLVCICTGVCFVFSLNVEQLLCKLEARFNFDGGKTLMEIKVSNTLLANGGDEIWYKGNLYDILAVKNYGDSSVLTVWHDADEQSVQGKMVNYFQNSIEPATHSRESSVSAYHSYIPEGKIMPQPITFTVHYFAPCKIACFFSNTCRIPARYLDDVLKQPPDSAI